MTNKKYAVTGIANAIVDILAYTDDRFLEANSFIKGSMTLISDDEAANLANLHYEKICSGGSGSNTIACLANLDIKTGLIGKIGDDKFGKIFEDELQKINVDFFCNKKSANDATARSYILVSEDGQRTMCTYLGCASNIENEIDENIIASSNILYLEGYLWDRADTIDALKKSIAIARKNHTLTAFTLSDKFCVLRHHDEFLNIARELDILFSNESEINALLNTDSINFEKISQFSVDNDLIILVTRAENGAIIFDGKNSGNYHEVFTSKIENVIDTTGAGDCFAAGFLYGFTKNYSLEDATKIGNLLAGTIITKLGARFYEGEVISLKNQIINL